MSHEIRLPKVAPVIPDTITVTLTERHIIAGARCNKHSCPFALAFRDAGFGPVAVGTNWVAVVINNEWHQYFHPEKVQRMIRGFDNGMTGEMRPGTYTFTTF